MRFLRSDSTAAAGQVPPAPVAALLMTADVHLQRAVEALAASTDIRVLPVVGLEESFVPRAPLCLVGPDAIQNVGAQLDETELILVLPPGQTAAEFSAYAAKFSHIVALPDGEKWLMRRFAHAGDLVSGFGTAISVQGVVGGIGVSTLSAILAGAAGLLDMKSSIVDGDPSSCGIDVTLGIEGERGPRWPDLLDQDGNLRDIPRGAALRAALPRWRSTAVLTARATGVSATPTAVSGAISALARAHGIVVVDRGNAARNIPIPSESSVGALTSRSNAEVLVVPRTVAGVVAAHAVLARVADHQSGSNTVVVTRASPGSVLTVHDVERALIRPVACDFPEVASLGARMDRGEGPPGPRARLWRTGIDLLTELLAQTAPRNSRPSPHLSTGATV